MPPSASQGRAGAVSAALAGPWVVLALLACGLCEVVARRERLELPPLAGAVLPIAALTAAIPPLAWMSLKVGALSYGGGFVIIPLMQADAVGRHHWMTASQFLNAVALGQITPGPVVQTVAVVGYAAAGVVGGLVAAAIAFAPSFLFVMLGARHFDRLRESARARAFLDGAGPAAIGAIAGAAVPLARALHRPWQAGVLLLALVSLFLLRRGVVTTLLGAAAIGALIAVAGIASP
jgi:chromate transporter